jgi:hypothetical protein
MNFNSRLKFLVKEFIKLEQHPELLGVIAYWKDETAYLEFYLKNEDEEIKENLSVLSGEIIAQFPSGNLNEKYFVADTNNLPASTDWVIKR